ARGRRSQRDDSAVSVECPARPLELAHGPDRLDVLAFELKASPRRFDSRHQGFVDDVHGPAQLAISPDEKPRLWHCSRLLMFPHQEGCNLYASCDRSAAAHGIM